VSEQVAQDWMQVRQKKHAPLTQTAINAVQREAQTAGISFARAVEVAAENSWQGFKAAWYANLQNGSGGNARASPANRPMTYHEKITLAAGTSLAEFNAAVAAEREKRKVDDGRVIDAEFG
jgi:hypothetical protein